MQCPPKTEQRITIRQLATLAGVSATTVSRALRSDPRVSAEVGNRIKKLAEESNYRPDAQLTALSRRMLSVRNQHVPTRAALVISAPRTRTEYIQNGQTGVTYKSLLAQAAAMGVQFDEFWTHDQKLTHRRLASIIDSRGLENVIFAVAANCVEEGLHLDWEKTCAVAIDTRPLPVPMHRVITSEITGIEMILSRIADLGYRRPGFATSPQILHAREERPACGYQRFGPLAFGELPPLFVSDLFSPEKKLFLDWCDREGVDVVIADNRHCHHPLFEYLQEVPEDRRPAYVCTDLDPEDTPHIAGVYRCSETLGRAAVRLLLSLISSHDVGVPTRPVRWMFDPEFRNAASLPPTRHASWHPSL